MIIDHWGFGMLAAVAVFAPWAAVFVLSSDARRDHGPGPSRAQWADFAARLERDRARLRRYLDQAGKQ